MLELTGIHRLLIQHCYVLIRIYVQKTIYLRKNVCFHSFPTHNYMLHSNFNLVLQLLTFYNSQDHKVCKVRDKKCDMYVV